jgi:hypothetical protein
MEPQITFQPVEILTDGKDHEGCLVLADGKLVAVLVRLTDPVYDRHLLGAWYLEIGFGAALEMRHDAFASLDEAAQVIGGDLTKSSSQLALH